MSPGARWWPGRGGALALLAVLVLGLLHLPHPFEWDQATFTLGARQLAAGGVLYRDFWDVKQPGIYWFYLVAGRLFGFHEPGIHLFELLWMMSLAVTLLFTLRRRWGPGPAATLAPLLAVGAYYAAAGAWHLTQVEALVGLPLYLTLWFATRGREEEPRAWRSFVSGLCGAVVLMFKLAFLPLVGAFWLAAFVDASRGRGRGPARALVTVALPVALGAAIPLGAALAYFAHHQLLGALRWTWFVVPARLASHVRGTRVGTFFDGLQWFLLRFSPLLGLAVVGAGSSPARRDGLGLGLVLWLALAFPVILVQRWSWWEYHYLLCLVPLGVLAAAGIGTLWARLERTGAEAPAARRLATAALLALGAGLIGLAGMKAVLLARERFAITPADRIAYQKRVSPFYYRTALDLTFLAGRDRRPGAVYVLDNPLVYLHCNRPAAPALSGVLFLAQMGEPEWSVITSRLERAPPAFILVEPDFLAEVRKGAPGVERFAAFLAARYRESWTNGRDVWFERVD